MSFLPHHVHDLSISMNEQEGGLPSRLRTPRLGSHSSVEARAAAQTARMSDGPLEMSTWKEGSGFVSKSGSGT